MPTESKSQVFPLRLPLSTRIQAAQFAEREGISLNQFILVALSEKIERFELQDSEPLDSDEA
jgi:predicted HicB family RNase H-like nuclease